MRRPAVLALVPSVLVLLALAAPAAAHHTGDFRLNMVHLFQSPNATVATNSDLAFWGDRAYAGNYDGFRIFDISDPAAPLQLADVRCAGNQADPIVWQNRLLLLSVDEVMEGSECGAEPADATDRDALEDPGNWEGVRIFDVSDPSNVTQIKAVETDCGAHTITLFPKNPAQLMVYVSSYSLRPGPACGTNTGDSPVHEKISVIRVPVKNPKAAKVVATPKISYPGDPDNVFDPQEHGLPELQGTGIPFGDLTACHDIGVFVELRLAAGACAEQSQLWRIKRNGIPDTRHPLWVFDDTVDETGTTGDADDPGVVIDFHHSATFSADGSIVNIIDESFGEGCPTTTDAPVGGDSGRMFFLDAATGKKFSHFMIDGARQSGDYCSAHLGNVVPTADRNLLVNAWYTGGVDVIDFTDPSNPVEIAYYDHVDDPATPFLDENQNNWSAYWYEGPSLPEGSLTIYTTQDDPGTEEKPSAFGFDVFRADIDVNEQKLPFLNPQTQMRVLGSSPKGKGNGKGVALAPGQFKSKGKRGK